MRIIRLSYSRFCVLVLLGSLCCAGCDQYPFSPRQKPAASQEQLQQQLAQVNDLMQQGQHQEAARKLEKLIDSHPEQRLSLQTTLMGAYMAQDQADRALSVADSARIAAPTDENLLLMRARILERLGRVDEAAEQYREITQLNPLSVNACAQLAALLASSGRLVESASQYTLCTRIAPESGALYYSLALVQKRLGRDRDALHAARQAKTLSAGDFQSHRLYQDIAISLGFREELIGEYQSLVEANPNSSEVHYLYGRILEDPEAARASFSIANQVDPQSFRPPYALGIQDYIEGNYTQARQNMQAALEAATRVGSPEALLADMYLALIDIAEQKYEEAKTRIQSIIQRHADDVRPLTVLHRLHLETGNFEQARQTAQQMATLGPAGTSLAAAAELSALLQGGQLGQARTLASSILSEGSRPAKDRETAAMALAQIFMEEANPQAALEQLRSASASGLLKEPLSRFWLGWLEHQSGNSSAARKVWETLASERSRLFADEDVFYADSARFWLGQISPSEFEKMARYYRYTSQNDFWAVRALKLLQEGNPAEARVCFEKSLQQTRASEFPGRLVSKWLKETG